ncbi:MAG: hypothetical protein IPJ34_41320 [Myxococcales bacterium]|nr:hypothetical protein [Myxococcales bacterium]MBL8718950.1 hypothetical protein [Myxococcales bacterium]
MRRSSLVLGPVSVGLLFVVVGRLPFGGTPSSAAPIASSAATAKPSVVASVPVVAAPSGSACGCVAVPKTTASLAVTGDEKMSFDPTDAQADLTVTYGRAAAGKKTVVVAAVFRAFRTDLPSERPTTISLRITLAEGSTTPASNKEVDAYVTTWGTTPFALRAYATVVKSTLTATVTDDLVELRGSVVLKDGPTNRSVTVDKLTVKKTGAGLLPVRTGVFKVP